MGVQAFPDMHDQPGLMVRWSEGKLAVDGSQLDAATVDQVIKTLITGRREAFGQTPPTAAVVEIVERGERQIDETGASTLIMPTDVRINGVSVWTTGGVRVHEMHLPPREMPTVTFTLPVRLLIVGAESDPQLPELAR